MQANRVPTPSVLDKPRVVLDDRFPFAKTLQVGDKGQLDVSVLIDSVSLRPDENGDERFHYVMLIEQAEILNNLERRT